MRRSTSPARNFNEKETHPFPLAEIPPQECAFSSDDVAVAQKESLMVIWNEGATQAQEDEGKDIIDVLTTIYPGHPWAVRVYDGGFFIRHLAFPANWGMNCHARNVDHDAAVMKREIILMAGEWLERAGLARGRYDSDQDIQHLEGAPDKVQPNRPPVAFERTVFASESTWNPLRDEPRPQVLKESA